MVIVALYLDACGSDTRHPVTSGPTVSVPATSSTATSPTTVSATAPTSTRPAAGGRVVTLTDKDKGTSVTVHVGDSIDVVLGSTYWTFLALSDTTVLRSDGSPDVVPQKTGCVPGQGCGTVTAVFTAVGAGAATIAATRTSCGEAMGCTPSNGRYEVNVSVS